MASLSAFFAVESLPFAFTFVGLTLNISPCHSLFRFLLCLLLWLLELLVVFCLYASLFLVPPSLPLSPHLSVYSLSNSQTPSFPPLSLPPACMNKVPVLVGDSPGFVLNRIASVWYSLAGHLVVHGGASVRRIDALMCEVGFVAGPLAILDSITLATVERVGSWIAKMLDPEMNVKALPALLPAMQARGWTGRTHKGESCGFYRWKDGRQQGLNEEVRVITCGRWHGNCSL